jgi:hypothetical protein
MAAPTPLPIPIFIASLPLVALATRETVEVLISTEPEFVFKRVS